MVFIIFYSLAQLRRSTRVDFLPTSPQPRRGLCEMVGGDSLLDRVHLGHRQMATFWTEVATKHSTGHGEHQCSEFEGKTLVLVEVVNFGDRPTTITNLGFSFYRNRWNKLIKRSGERNAIITGQRIPFELRQGTSWTGYIIQTDD